MLAKKASKLTASCLMAFAIVLTVTLAAMPVVAFGEENVEEEKQELLGAGQEEQLSQGQEDVLQGSGVQGAVPTVGNEEQPADDQLPAGGEQPPANSDQPLADGQQPADNQQGTVDDDQQQLADDQQGAAGDDQQQPTDDQQLADDPLNADDPFLAPATGEEEEAEQAEPPLADGVYIIDAAVANEQVVDVAGGRTSNGTNVQTYTYNGSGAQKWEFVFEKETGAYFILLNGTSKALEFKGGTLANKTNVQINEKDDAKDEQRWILSSEGEGPSKLWTIACFLNPSFVLDIQAGRAANKANIQIYKSNGSAAQKYYLLTTDPAEAGTQVIPDGLYTIRAKGKVSLALDIAGGSLANSANARLYSANDSSAQKWYFKYDGVGYYTITVISSGKVLDLAGGRLTSGTNVRQYDSNETNAQKWVVSDNGDGSVSLINMAARLFLDVAGGKLSSYTNVRGYRGNSTIAQQWVLKAAEYLNLNEENDKGIYEIKPLGNEGLNLDIKGASASNGAPAQLYTDNDTLAQRYEVVWVGHNQYKIRTAASGGWLTDNGLDVAVIQKGSSKTRDGADVWEPIWNGNYFSLLNLTTNRVLDLNGSISSGTGTRSHGQVMNRSAQHFRFVSADLLKPGYYELQSGLGKYADIDGGSFAAGANAQIYSRNNSSAQQFKIERAGTGYTITNFGSGLCLLTSGGNVQQGRYTGSRTQIWTAEIADGGYVNFRNASSGKYLDVKGGNNANGTNVREYNAWSPNTNNGQKWRLVSTTPSGWHRNNGRLYYKSDQAGDILITDSGYAAWRAVQNLSSKTKYLLVIDNTNNRVYCFTGSRGKWVPHGDWIAAVGVPPEVGGDETFGETFRGISEVRKKGYVMGWYPYEFYWTEFYINSHALESDGEGQRFHSVLYKNPNKPVDVWDDRLGVACTHGCVRLELDKAKWIYDNIPLGTKVWSY